MGYPSAKKRTIEKVITMQRINAEIAMYHFEAVAKEANINGRWVNENPKLTPIKNYIYINLFTLNKT